MLVSVWERELASVVGVWEMQSVAERGTIRWEEFVAYCQEIVRVSERLESSERWSWRSSADVADAHVRLID